MKYIKNPPDAASLMMSARSFGNYDLAGAIADLIDNSIKANARSIWLKCILINGEPEVRIVDDGEGMSAHELHAAMRPASTNPTEERSPDDLGRFGWGMKSASFSQCLSLTVISRKEGSLSGAVWDLEDLDGWKMGVLSKTEIRKVCSEHFLTNGGTEIVWEKCDRLSESGSLDQVQFNELIVHARNKIALIFHRYLSGVVKGKKLTIWLNGVQIPEYDPFYKEHAATQQLEAEHLKVSAQAKVCVQPYILPHYSKLKVSEFEKLAGDEGFLKNQGFYVYRNDRLIIYGTWFRLVKHGELSQLIRVSVDIPNSLDSLWKITVDKTDAQLPSILRNRLKQIVSGLKSRSSRVYQSKGGKITDKNIVSVWLRYAKGGEIHYELNRAHPLIAAINQNSSEKQQQAIEIAMRAIEQGFPVTNFCKDGSKHGVDAIHQTETNPERFKEFLMVSLPTLLCENNGNIEMTVEEIRKTDPYSSNWPMVEGFLVKEGWIDD